ncbi:MAG: molybdopterin-guanine dinucleotide biosynthesis protein [Microbacteriaceae bacterium]|nr:MAG: molybdopterin-guanine dinucleotide biosynthesis protein [Microbacteriaceae bacterium]
MLMDAVVLAGGRSSRLAGAAKAHLVYRGTTLLERAIAAAFAADARRVAVVGAMDGDGEPAAPARHFSSIRPDAGRLLFTREEPPFGGPAAGIAAGIAALDGTDPSGIDRPESAATEAEGDASARLLLVLACDLPHVARAVPALTTALPLPAGTDGVMLIDDDQCAQPLTAIYRRSALDAAAAARRARGELDGLSVRALIGALNLATVAAPAGSTDDIDTPADAMRFDIALHAPVGTKH